MVQLDGSSLSLEPHESTWRGSSPVGPTESTRAPAGAYGASMSKPCRLVSLALVAATLGACIVRLPAPPTPARRSPSLALPADQPAAGEGRVVIETTDGPATAELITGRAMSQAVVGGQVAYGAQLATRRLCTTPCVGHLPRGENEGVLARSGTSPAGQGVRRGGEPNASCYLVEATNVGCPALKPCCLPPRAAVMFNA